MSFTLSGKLSQVERMGVEMLMGADCPPPAAARRRARGCLKSNFSVAPSWMVSRSLGRSDPWAGDQVAVDLDHAGGPGRPSTARSSRQGRGRSRRCARPLGQIASMILRMMLRSDKNSGRGALARLMLLELHPGFLPVGCAARAGSGSVSAFPRRRMSRTRGNGGQAGLLSPSRMASWRCWKLVAGGPRTVRDGSTHVGGGEFVLAEGAAHYRDGVEEQIQRAWLRLPLGRAGDHDGSRCRPQATRLAGRNGRHQPAIHVLAPAMTTSGNTPGIDDEARNPQCQCCRAERRWARRSPDRPPRRSRLEAIDGRLPRWLLDELLQPLALMTPRSNRLQSVTAASSSWIPAFAARRGRGRRRGRPPPSRRWCPPPCRAR